MQLIVYPIVFLIAIMPFVVLRSLSSVLSFLFVFLLPYRKEVILKNLKQAFPEKNKREIRVLQRKFYRHYLNVFFETMKILTISTHQLKRKIHIIDNKPIQHMMKEEKGCIILSGHLGNFEWAGQFLGQVFPHPIHAAYRTFRASYYEKLMQKIRSRFNTRFVPANQILRVIIKNIQNGLYMFFLNDQLPTFSKEHCWVDFFSKETMFFTAPAKLAKKFKLPVYYMDMWREKGGNYKIRAELLTADPNKLSEAEVIQRYAWKLERSIRKQPEGWLWSHKRWKREPRNLN